MSRFTRSDTFRFLQLASPAKLSIMLLDFVALEAQLTLESPQSGYFAWGLYTLSPRVAFQLMQYEDVQPLYHAFRYGCCAR